MVTRRGNGLLGGIVGCNLQTNQIRECIRAINEVLRVDTFKTTDFINYCGRFDEDTPRSFRCSNVTIGRRGHTESRQYCGRILAKYARETGHIRRVTKTSPGVWQIIETSPAKSNVKRIVPMGEFDMPQIDTIFENLNIWRHLPTYQLERRLDAFLSFYLPGFIRLMARSCGYRYQY
jgi:hypothetical protein